MHSNGMLLSSHIGFFDQAFQLNNDILNLFISLLEKSPVYAHGIKLTYSRPISLVFRSNQLPLDNDMVRAILDRLSVKLFLDASVDTDVLENLLLTGRSSKQQPEPKSLNEQNYLYDFAQLVSFEYVVQKLKEFSDIATKQGLKLSSRNLKQFMELIMLSALRRQSQTASNEDFWCLKYLGESWQQQGILRELLKTE